MEMMMKWFGPMILSNLTPTLRSMLEGFVRQWSEAAKLTPNPWDNLAVAALAALLGMELEG